MNSSLQQQPTELPEYFHNLKRNGKCFTIRLVAVVGWNVILFLSFSCYCLDYLFCCCCCYKVPWVLINLFNNNLLWVDTPLKFHRNISSQQLKEEGREGGKGDNRTEDDGIDYCTSIPREDSIQPYGGYSPGGGITSSSTNEKRKSSIQTDSQPWRRRGGREGGTMVKVVDFFAFLFDFGEWGWGAIDGIQRHQQDTKPWETN